MKPVITDEWQKYINGKKYKESLTPVNLYTTVDNNESFYAGDQWVGVSGRSDLDRPVVNIFKKVINWTINSILSFQTKMRFSPMLIGDNPIDDREYGLLKVVKIVNRYSVTLWERLKMDMFARDALRDAALSGDACAHVYWNRNIATGQLAEGDIDIELIDNVNVFFGNPHDRRVNHSGYAVQPYIIIAKREMVSELREEARKIYEAKHRVSKKEFDPEVKITITKDEKANIDAIVSDKDDQYQSGLLSKIDIEGGEDESKAISLTCYFKKNGTIWYKKSTKFATICEEYDTGYKIYPVAWMNWDKRKNCCHGQALGTGMIPNQVMINKSYAAIGLWLRKMALPTIIYDKNRIKKWSFGLGAAIGVESVEGAVSNAVYIMQPGQIGGMVLNCINDIIANTKEMMGASSVSLGEVDNPENTSAIMAMQKAGAIPLEGNRAAFYQFIEDIGCIWIELMGRHYGLRKVAVMDDLGQNKIIEEIDFDILSDLPMQVKIDVGASSYWSENADINTLDNLLSNGFLQFEDYLKVLPDGALSSRNELLEMVKQRMLEQAQAAQAQAQQTLPQPPGQEQIPQMEQIPQQI